MFMKIAHNSVRGCSCKHNIEEKWIDLLKQVTPLRNDTNILNNYPCSYYKVRVIPYKKHEVMSL